jgi:hypothetical protein
MNWTPIIIKGLDVVFTLMEHARMSKEERLAFYKEQDRKFYGENRPENLPKPPEDVPE